MNKSDLRSKETKIMIVVLGLITLVGFAVPVSFLLDQDLAESIFMVDKSGSVGLGVIIVATTGGMFGALVIKRRFAFQYWTNIVCRKTGELMYENESQTKLFCPSHGEVEHEMYGENLHFMWKKDFDEQHKVKKPTKQSLEMKIDELENRLGVLSDELNQKNPDEYLKRNRD